MALFTDQSIVVLDELLQFETTLVQVASTHGINVETKINLATSVVGEQVMLWLFEAGASDPQLLARRALGLSTVVVTPPLRRWLEMESLARFFAEAYNVQLNPRFQGKWTEYQEEARKARMMASLAGIGIVYRPLPKPSIPLVSVQSGNAPAQSLFVQTAWVDGRGHEGALSPVNGIILGDGSTITVATAEGALEAPPAAIGWNVYVSSTDRGATRQNSETIGIGASWNLPTTGLTDGDAPINGQHPEHYVAILNRIRRA
jgi:hypothetical protein